MAQHPDEARRQKYFQLSSQLVQIDNAQLASLLDNSEPLTSWGRNQTIEIGDQKVFVKRIPMTDIEQANMFSTTNLYDLPTYYNYGIGSVGSGVFRELVAHVKTTNWVLNGEIANFPLLYHYRFMPRVGAQAEVDMEKHQRYVEYWGGSKNIGRYMLDRANASVELVLFLEYIPHVLQPWLRENPDQVEPMLTDACTAIDFLCENGIIHFDAHFYNVLTDGARTYLTDFGLVLDKSFALREDEQAFFDTHTDYDYGQLLSNLFFLLYDLYEALPADEQQQLRTQYGIPEEGNVFYPVLIALFEHVEENHASGLMKVPQAYRDAIAQYHRILALVGNFFAELQGNQQKDTQFPHTELQRLLNESGFVSDTDSGE